MHRSFAFLLFLFSLTSLNCLIPSTAKAQVTPDGTTSTTVDRDGNNFTVEQGDRVGDNLFHSFDEFSVPTGGSADFNNAADIANIFSRVTGSDISNIDGLLSASGAANLYLINPNGIIFGENARLDLGGSFFSSTADSLLFEGDTEFSAVNPDAAPLLEVSIPVGASFRDSPGDIVANPGSDLSVESEQNITLVGGNVTFDGATVIGSTQGKDNTITIGGLIESGTVAFQADGNLSFPPNMTRGNVSLSNSSSLITTSKGGGAIFIYADNFDLATDSAITSGVLLDTDTARASSGDIIIDARGDVTIDGADSDIIAGVFNSIIDTTSEEADSGIGEAGNIEISARNISVVNGGSVSSNVLNDNQSGNNSEPNRSSNIILNAEEEILVADSNARFPSDISNLISLGNGNGGAIELTAQNLTVRDDANIESRISEFADGIAGDIELEIGNIALTGGGQINSISLGDGDGGDVNIVADSISVDNSDNNSIFLNFPSRISSSTEPNGNDVLTGNPLGQGKPGNINVATNSLEITNGGQLTAISESSGNGGDIQIVAREKIVVNGGVEQNETRLVNNTGGSNTSGQGNAGNLSLTTPKLIVTNNGFISASTQSQGDAGNLSIDAASVAVEQNAQIVADVFPSSNGTGGNLTIDTENLAINSGGQISASTLKDGDAGNLSIDAANSIAISGRGSDSNTGLFVVAFNGEGRGGELNIDTQDLSIADGGTINVGNFPSPTSFQSPGIGEPGNLTIQADSISLENDSSITAATQSPIGNGANINLISEDITLDDNALISARAFGDANGGNLNIDSGFILAFPEGNNDIVARAEQGNGGQITIDTEAIFGLEERVSEPANFTNDIDASSEFGLQGDFALNTPDFDPTTGLIELPTSVGDASDRISQNPCQQGAGSEFIVTGQGGLPLNPNGSLGGSEVEVGLVEPSDLSPSSSPAKKGEQDKQGEDTETVQTKALSSEVESVPAQGWIVNDRGEVTLTAIALNDERMNRGEISGTACSRTNE